MFEQLRAGHAVIRQELVPQSDLPRAIGARDHEARVCRAARVDDLEWQPDTVAKLVRTRRRKSEVAIAQAVRQMSERAPQANARRRARYLLPQRRDVSLPLGFGPGAREHVGPANLADQPFKHHAAQLHLGFGRTRPGAHGRSLGFDRFASGSSATGLRRPALTTRKKQSARHQRSPTRASCGRPSIALPNW
jgi:hypothetical protein